MKWQVISPRGMWNGPSGTIADRTVVEADKVQVVDGCLVFTDQIKDGPGFTVQPVLLLGPTSWSMCVPWPEERE